MADLKINLLAKLKKLSNIELFFSGLTAQKDRDGKMIAILQLEQPIPHVRGSQEVEWNGRMQPIVAKDVVEIKVHEEDMNDDFEFSEDGDTGAYKGSDLVLDVSKNGVVWLRKSTLAASANNFRADARNKRLGKLFGEPVKTPDVKNEPKPAVKPVDVVAAGPVAGKKA